MNKKQIKQFLILIIIAVVAIAALIIVNTYVDKAEAESEAAEEAETITVLSIDAAGVTEISYVYDGETLTFSFDGESWTCEDDESIDIDEDLVDEMVDTLSLIEANEMIDDYDDLSDYGLSDPSNTITIATDDEEYVIYIGDENEFSYDYYMMLDGDDAVYTVDSGVAAACSYSVEDLTAEEEEEDEEEEEEDAEEEEEEADDDDDEDE